MKFYHIALIFDKLFRAIYYSGVSEVMKFAESELIFLNI